MNNVIQQIAAFFIRKNGEKLPYNKFMKLLYIANRYMMNEYGYAHFFEKYVTILSNGPQFLKASICIEKENDFVKLIFPYHDFDPTWIDLIENSVNVFDELSQIQKDNLEKTWDMHGHQNDEELLYYMKTLYSEMKFSNVTYLDIMNAMDMKNSKEYYDEMVFWDHFDAMLLEITTY